MSLATISVVLEAVRKAQARLKYFDGRIFTSSDNSFSDPATARHELRETIAELMRGLAALAEEGK